MSLYLDELEWCHATRTASSRMSMVQQLDLLLIARASFVCPPREDRRFSILGVGEKGVPHSYWRRSSAHLTFKAPPGDAEPLCIWVWGAIRLEQRAIRSFFLGRGRKHGGGRGRCKNAGCGVVAIELRAKMGKLGRSDGCFFSTCVLLFGY